MTTLTDHDLAVICGALYGDAPVWDIHWNESSWGLCAALRVVGARDVVVHRGSLTPQDWYDDAISEIPFADPVGPLPLGFGMRLRPWYEATRTLIRPGAVIIGHSLGAARAVEHAGMLAAEGRRPAAVVVWGEPKPGMAKLKDVLAAVPIRSYRNRSDPVPTVPVTLGLLEWTHGHPLIAVDAAPAANDSWGVMADHHFELYEAAMAALSPMPGIDL